MKQNASPVMIVVAVVAVLAILAGGYWLTIGGGSSKTKTAEKWAKPVTLPAQQGGSGGLVMPQVPAPPSGSGGAPVPTAPGQPGGVPVPQAPSLPKGP